MRMPNAERAKVDMQKLVGYCLSPTHDLGKHKARVFAAALNWTVDNAEEVRTLLKQAATKYDATVGERDAYGQRYVVDFPVQGPRGDVWVRSAWIIRTDEDFPRLTSSYVIDEEVRL